MAIKGKKRKSAKLLETSNQNVQDVETSSELSNTEIKEKPSSSWDDVSDCKSIESYDEDISDIEIDKDSNSDVVSDEENSKKNSKFKHNPGWADAMAKILKTNKPKRKKTVVLAKAKKLKINQEDQTDNLETFQIEGADEEKPKIKLENGTSIKSEVTSKSLAVIQMARRNRKKAIESRGRVKPSVLDKDREKVLTKVATKGVVQLFNAVQQQQKSLVKEIQKVGPSDAKKDKVLKSVDKKAFLDVLMGAKSQSVPLVKDEPESNSQWSVLRDDFLMSSKLKDWDKDDNDLKE